MVPAAPQFRALVLAAVGCGLAAVGCRGEADLVTEPGVACDLRSKLRRIDWPENLAHVFEDCTVPISDPFATLPVFTRRLPESADCSIEPGAFWVERAPSPDGVSIGRPLRLHYCPAACIEQRAVLTFETQLDVCNLADPPPQAGTGAGAPVPPASGAPGGSGMGGAAGQVPAPAGAPAVPMP